MNFTNPVGIVTEAARRILGDRVIGICDAPLDVCEKRDAERLFARARAGEIANVTGVDQPYETPNAPDLRLDTATVGVDRNLRNLVDVLETRGWLGKT